MSSQQQVSQLRAEQAGDVALLTIDRPARRNALGHQLIEDLFTQLDRAERDPATRVIVLFMDGGPSQVDTFDPKPALEKYHGKPFPAKIEPTQFNAIGSTLASPAGSSPATTTA